MTRASTGFATPPTSTAKCVASQPLVANTAVLVVDPNTRASAHPSTHAANNATPSRSADTDKHSDSRRTWLYVFGSALLDCVVHVDMLLLYHDHCSLKCDHHTGIVSRALCLSTTAFPLVLNSNFEMGKVGSRRVGERLGISGMGEKG